MSIKRTMLSIASGVVMLAPLAGNVHAATVNCSSSTTTVVTSVNTNTLFSSQTVIANGTTGGNGTWGNIGGGNVRTGRVVSLANLGLSGNTSSTLIGLTGGGSTNSCSVVNTGN